MNTDVKQKWVAALRSGDYRQGTARLRNPENTYCCLGVLCDLFAQEKGIEWRHRTVEIDDGEEDRYDFLGSSGYLPNEVVEWSGLEHENPVIPTAGDRRLAQHNDSGKSFAEIAQLIEEYL